MKIGITFDLKEEAPLTLPLNGGDNGFASPSQGRDGHRSPPLEWGDRGGIPDDLHEEFDSPATVESVASVLRDLGHDVVKLGDGRQLLERLLADPPDFVFNFAEGQGIGRSREARVPAVLEMLGIPYTGSDPLTLAVTLDKDCAKRLIEHAGITVPRGLLVNPTGHLELEELGSVRAELFPVIVKPAWEGSSKGIRQHSVVEKKHQLRAVVERLWNDYRQPLLVEEYIEGDELTVGVIGNDPPRVIGVMRVLPCQPTERFIYSLEVKRDFRKMVRYECPPRLPNPALAAVEKAALDSYRVLGCRDIARVDFRLRDGVPYFLEVNPLPGLNPDSGDIVILSGLCGWSYRQLIEGILESAMKRAGIRSQGPGVRSQTVLA